MSLDETLFLKKLFLTSSASAVYNAVRMPSVSPQILLRHSLVSVSATGEKNERAN